MLAAAQKAVILRRSGIAVPPLPVEMAANEGGIRPTASAAGEAGAPTAGDAAQERALRLWTAQVNALFVSYVAARAAKSLREAEEVRQMDELRHLASSHGWTRAARPRGA